MGTTFDRWWLWVVANLIGMALFLHLATQTWIEPELANEPGASGESITVRQGFDVVAELLGGEGPTDC